MNITIQSVHILFELICYYRIISTLLLQNTFRVMNMQSAKKLGGQPPPPPNWHEILNRGAEPLPSLSSPHPR